MFFISKVPPSGERRGQRPERQVICKAPEREPRLLKPVKINLNEGCFNVVANSLLQNTMEIFLGKKRKKIPHYTGT